MIVVFLGIVAVRPPGHPRRGLDQDLDAVAIYAVVAAGLVTLYGRVGMISLGQIALLADRHLDGDAHRVRIRPAVPVAAARHRRDHLRRRRRDRPAGAPPERALPRADHADGGRCRERRADHDQFPERRRRLHGPHLDPRPLGPRARRPAGHRRGRHGVLPLHDRRVRAHVPADRRCTSPRSPGGPGRRFARASRRRSRRASTSSATSCGPSRSPPSRPGSRAGCWRLSSAIRRAFGFPTQDSLTLLAAALIGGIYSLWGAVVAGLFSQLAPFLFQAQWGIDPNFLLIIFGVGLLQVLLTAPRGIVVQMPQDIRNLGRLGVRLYRKVSGPRGET